MRRYLRYFLPQSLFSQTALAMLAILIFTHLFGAWWAYQSQTKMIAHHLREEVLDTLYDYEEVLNSLTPTERSAFLAEHNTPYQIQLKLRNHIAPSPKDTQLSGLAWQVEQDLHASLDASARVLHQAPPKPQLWLPVIIATEKYWLVIPLGRYQQPPLWQLPLPLILFIILFIPVLGLLVWRINRPLQRLSTQAQHFAKTGELLAFNAEGPREIALLGQVLQHSLQSLAEQDSERKLMLAGLSHDLRTPLSRLSLAIELSVQDDNEQMLMLQDIAEMQAIVNQFINYAKAIDEEIQCFLLHEYLQDFFSHQQKYFSIDYQATTESQTITADIRPLALQRALSNIIENAKRYGKAPLHCQLRIQNQTLVLDCYDMGTGVAKEQLDFILRPFVRLNPARTSDGGVGLGFSIMARCLAGQATFTLDNQIGAGLRVQIQFSYCHAN